MRRSSYEYIIPALMALLITLGMIHYITALSSRYLLMVEQSEETRPDYFRCYYDLDADGYSEVIELFYNSAGNLAVKFRYLSEATINQFNLPGELVDGGAKLEFHDINADGHCDVFVCTEKNDSLYLSIIDDVFSHPTFARRFVLDPINLYNDNADYNYIPGGLIDLNGDGRSEYIMAINGGHSLQPRRVYAIDYYNDTVLRSPASGAAIHKLGFADLDGDQRDEILVNTTATSNFNFAFPYMDTTAWFMTLDNQLNFYRPPVSLNEHLSFVELEYFTHEGESYILAVQRYRQKDKKYSNLGIYDDSYKLIAEREIYRPGNMQISIWRDGEESGLENLKLIINQSIYSLGFDLAFTDSLSRDFPMGSDHCRIRFDLDRNGDMECIFPSREDIVVLRSELNHPASVNVNWSEKTSLSRIFLVENGDESPLLYIYQDLMQYWLSYRPNIWFKYRVLVYPLIFGLLFMLFYFTGRFQNRLVRRRYEKDQLISQLQLQSIKNQLDPHFIHNTLNAVGSLIYKGEKELAYQYLKGVSDLLRMVSGDASEVCWSLAQELEFVHKFLDIEKLRFREKFVYTVEEEETLMDFQVPKLSVLTFVENALKHGLRHKVNDRKLEIKVESLDGGLRIGIRDNGIGQKASVKYREEKSGKGIQIMKKYFAQFNEASGREGRFEITDLFAGKDEAAGTLVEIYII